MDAVEEKRTLKRASKKTVQAASAKSRRSDSIVTARVPSEIRDQGNEILKKIGSTPTELVNAAYEYVLKNEELPSTSPSLAELKGKHRVLSPEQKEMLRERMRKTTLHVPDSYWQGKTDDELIEDAVREKYESLP